MNSIIQFVKEAWAELKQVSWLTVPQVIASTWIVVVLVIVMAIYLGGVDVVISRILGALV